MEFKLKDSELEDTLSENSKDKISDTYTSTEDLFEHEKVDIQDEILGVDEKEAAPETKDVSVLSMIGTLLIFVWLISGAINLVIGADDRSARKKITKSYVVTGQVAYLSDIDMIVNHLHKSENDSTDRYKVEWKQTVKISYDDKSGQSHTVEDQIVIDQLTEYIGENEPYHRNSIQYVKDMYKDTKVTSPYTLNQKLELYVDNKDPNSVYQKSELDERTNTSDFRKKMKAISFAAFALFIMCFAVDGIFEKKKGA